MVKRFNELSTEHWGAKVGDKFKTIKHHHEINGDLEEGTELILDSIIHFPTLYRLKDKTKVRGENLKNYKEVGIENFPKYMIRKKPKGTAASEKPTDEMDGRGAYPK